MGNSASGSSEVMAISTASLIHQTAIRSNTAPVRCAAGSMPSGVGASNAMMNTATPRMRTTFLRRTDCSELCVKGLLHSPRFHLKTKHIRLRPGFAPLEG